jgi:hypothetical protein
LAGTTDLTAAAGLADTTDLTAADGFTGAGVAGLTAIALEPGLKAVAESC